MAVGTFRPTADSRAISEALAKAAGLPFDMERAESRAGRLLTFYFQDIRTALAPRFDHIESADFTQRQINAFSDYFVDDQKRYIHVDQLFEMWLHSLIHLWSVRAFHNLSESSREDFNSLFGWALDVRDDPNSHEVVREDMLHVFAKFPEAMQMAHQLTIASMVFIVCHELAHHELEHLGRNASHALEYEADKRGYDLMREIYAYPGTMATITRPSYGMVGAWMVLRILDLSERRQAQRRNRKERRRLISHPPASDRLERLQPLLNQEQNRNVEDFMDGYGIACTAITRDLHLTEIK